MTDARATCAAGCGAVVGHPGHKCHECATAAVRDALARKGQHGRGPVNGEATSADHDQAASATTAATGTGADGAEATGPRETLRADGGAPAETARSEPAGS